VNIPISLEGLKTKCEKYLNSKYKEDSEIMDLVDKSYDKEKQLYTALAKYNSLKRRGGSGNSVSDSSGHPDLHI
jgi:hypothetical protein